MATIEGRESKRLDQSREPFQETIDQAEALFQPLGQKSIQRSLDAFYAKRPGLKRLSKQAEPQQPLPDFSEVFEPMGRERITKALDDFYTEHPGLLRRVSEEQK